MNSKKEERCDKCGGSGVVEIPADTRINGQPANDEECKVCKGTGLKSKVEGVEYILKRSLIDMWSLGKNGIGENWSNTKWDIEVKKVATQLRQSIERETIEKVEKIRQPIFNHDIQLNEKLLWNQAIDKAIQKLKGEVIEMAEGKLPERIVIHDPANNRNLVIDVTKGGCQYWEDVKIVNVPKEDKPG